MLTADDGLLLTADDGLLLTADDGLLLTADDGLLLAADENISFSKGWSSEFGCYVLVGGASFLSWAADGSLLVLVSFWTRWFCLLCVVSLVEKDVWILCAILSFF